MATAKRKARKRLAKKKARKAPARKRKASKAPPSPKMGGRRKMLDARELAVAKFEESGLYSTAARAAGINRHTLHRWTREEPEFKQKMDEARTAAIAILEDELMKMAKKGNLGTVKFALQQLAPEKWGKYDKGGGLPPMPQPGARMITLTLVDDGPAELGAAEAAP